MSALVRGAAALAVLLLAACTSPAPRLPAARSIPSPDPARVDRVLFLVGDAGDATMQTAPILPRLRQDVEGWAQALGADSAVAVLYLGDIVYPLGLNPPGSSAFTRDSAVVMGQVQVVSGPAARAHRAQAYFMAGNHDWGLEEEWEGFVRLQVLEDFLDRAREATGASVRLVPEAGAGGPYVVDLGERVRLLMLDTAWWLLDGGRMAGEGREAVLAGIAAAMETAGGREVLLAAHHPFKSAGPHGGELDFWETLGLRYLLARSGAILQDLTSVPYRELETGLREIFARSGPPRAFIGGHEHSLQVFGATEPDDPLHSIVSGSASKLTGIGNREGMTFGSSTPGYMRLVVEKGGAMSLFVESAPAEYLSCGGGEEARLTCMAEGVAAFRTVHSQRLDGAIPPGAGR